MCPHPTVPGTTLGQELLPATYCAHGHLFSTWAVLPSRASATYVQAVFWAVLGVDVGNCTVAMELKQDVVASSPSVPTSTFLLPKGCLSSCTLCGSCINTFVQPKFKSPKSQTGVSIISPERLIPEIIKLIISKFFFFILSLNFAFPNLIPLLFIILPPLPLGTTLINSSPSLVLLLTLQYYSSMLKCTPLLLYLLSSTDIFELQQCFLVKLSTDLYSMLLFISEQTFWFVYKLLV